MNPPNGGPAFPCPTYQLDPRDNVRGMTLRDWFAGQALAGMLSGRASTESVSAGAYAIADAMLAERAKEAR